METLLWQNGKPLDHILVLLCNNDDFFPWFNEPVDFLLFIIVIQNSIANGHLESAILLLDNGAMVDVPNKGIHYLHFNFPFLL